MLATRTSVHRICEALLLDVVDHLFVGQLTIANRILSFQLLNIYLLVIVHLENLAFGAVYVVLRHLTLLAATLCLESHFAVHIIYLLVADHSVGAVAPISSFLTLLVASTLHVITLKLVAIHALGDLERYIFTGGANIKVNIYALSF